ncbi:alpha-1,2-fucosyltransferase [Pedobacter sp.]|uniref:alpha-1,2-fucosyltransferase n=1 Tax=Pedobacter sp. TaxID=1411316 RepID=UPI0031DB0811
MITVHLQGRLGNQLFQYAFIYAAAKTLKTNFYIDKQTESFILPKYFNLKEEFTAPFDLLFNINGYKNLFSFRLKKFFYRMLRMIFNLRKISFDNESDPLSNLLELRNQTIYEGFFQSAYYFTNIEKEIESLFELKQEFKSEFQQVVEKFPANKTIVAVHIRKGDYIDLGWNLPIEYYHQIIKELPVESSYFIFLSDQPKDIANEFNYIPNKYISHHEEIIDFQFLLNADICILANSSFSWWGAYLNKKKTKVFAPKFWLGKDKELPKDILPKNWTKC